jgi:probable F420-dependent oxidoreductase
LGRNITDIGFQELASNRLVFLDLRHIISSEGFTIDSATPRQYYSPEPLTPIPWPPPTAQENEMKISINPFRTERWFDDDPRCLTDLVRLADRKGIDAVDLTEHILMSADGPDQYPYKDPNMREQLFDARTPFFETLIQLAAFASITEQIRLSVGVLLSPLRTATLLAKQLATLDRLSGGRVDLGVGVGWQRLEYDAEGLPWEGRFGRMTEIAKACKVLWTQAPASFHGKHVNFDNVYSLPFPVQEGGIPQWFGIAPSDLNIERMAEVADGWSPLGVPLEVVVGAMRKIKARMAELGRDPRKFSLRLYPTPVYTDEGPDLDATLATFPQLLDAGATHISILVVTFCSKPEHFEPFLDKYLAAKLRYQRA